MPERMGILHLAVSVLLLVADSNGGTWRHGIGFRHSPHDTPSRLLSAVKEGTPSRLLSAVKEGTPSRLLSAVKEGTPSRLLSAVKEGPNETIPYSSRFLGELHSRRPESEMSSFRLHCKHEGFIAVQGTCRDVVRCTRTDDSGVFSVSVHVCPPDTIFDDVSTICIIASQATARPKCKTREFNNKFNFVDTLSPFESEGDNKVNGVIALLRHMNLGESLPLTRQKRQIPLSAGSLTHDFIFKEERGTDGVYSFIGGETSLDRIEDYLTGFKGMLDNVNLPDLESKTERKIFRDITELIGDTSLRNIKSNFDTIQKLIRNDIIEDLAITTVLQGMISDESKLKESKLAEVKATMREVEEFIYQEIDKSKTYVRKGFEMLSDSSNVASIKPLVSRLLNLTTEFKQNLKRLQGLPEKLQEIDIETRVEYKEYLQPSTLQDTLYDIINRNLAIPKTDSDTTALAFLDLLVQGLQVHVKLLSFAVSANVFTAMKAHKDRDLEKFNVCMSRVHSAMSSVKTFMGNRNSEGLISNVRTLFDSVEELSHSSRIDGLLQLLNEMRLEVDQIESHIKKLIEGNVIIPTPEIVTEEPNLSTNSTPFKDSKCGRHVSYAIQLVSGKRLSKVSNWSESYSTLDNAHPTVHIPATENGTTRLVYRRFNQGKPEVVAILTDNKVKSFRDVNRDLKTVASGTDLDETLGEVKTLLGDGANAKARFENEMTPLHYAAKYGNVGVMDILINKTADIGAKSFDGEEPLHLAAFSGSEEAIRYLINKTANVNAKTKLLGLSPLHIAVANNHTLSAKALIEGGAQVNIQDKRGISPLHLAVTAGNMDVLKVLLSSDQLDINAVTKGGLAALHIAAMVSDDLVFKELLKYQNISVDSLSDSQISLIHLASIYSNEGTIKSMIQHGLPVADVDKDGSTPLHYAAFYGNFGAVFVLGQSLKDLLNNDNKSAIDIAVKNNREAIAGLLRDDVLYNRSEEHQENLSKEMAEKINSGSDQICENIVYVDLYVNLVKSMIPLKIYYKGNHSYSKIFTDYDMDLIAAQNHAKPWRDGESIVLGIKNIFGQVRTFNSDFSRKYEINKDRIEVIQKQENTNEEDRDNKISVLKHNISEFRVARDNAIHPIVKLLLNKELTDKQRELDQLENTTDSVSERELREVIFFLELVQIDTGTIRTEANKTREKVQTFKAHLALDLPRFERHNEIARQAMTKFEEENLSDIEKLCRKTEEQEHLDNRIKKLNDEIRDVNIMMNNAKKLKLNVENNVHYNEKRSGYKVGSYAYNVYYAHQLEKIENEYMTFIGFLNTITKHGDEEIDKMKDAISTSWNSTDEIRTKGLQLFTLKRDLDTVIYNTEILIQALDKAKSGVTDIKQVFDDVDQKLSEMISKAKDAKDGIERYKAKYLIYSEISILESNWKKVHLTTWKLDACTRGSYASQLNRK